MHHLMSKMRTKDSCKMFKPGENLYLLQLFLHPIILTKKF